MTSFDTLKRDVSAYLEDDGDEFFAALPRIIDTAHAAIVDALDLTIHDGVEGFSCVKDQEWIDLPNPVRHVDFLQYGNGTVIERRSLSYCRMMGGTQPPVYFYQHGPQRIFLAPVPRTSYPLKAYVAHRATNLSGAGEDWYTQNLPDLMLKGCMIEACRFLKNPERAAEYEKDFSALLALARNDHADLVRPPRKVM